MSIKVKAGNGGNGAVSFHREKFVENGGPDGGDGGKGGDIVFLATENMHTLLDFRFHRRFYAEDGENGGQKRQTGKSGKDLVIKVPVGTVIREKESSAVVADLCSSGEQRVLFRGGRGGAGNARFATPVRQAPAFAKPGEKTREYELVLELKTIADVGLVGFPNVGKSTLLSVVSAARPKIANYHFTTLEPNLGVVKVDEDGFVMADIPGIIEGAAEGAGLGHQFLRHVERTRLLLHVLDISGSEGRDPIEDYRVINQELTRYGNLSQKPQIIVANKMDLPSAQEQLERFKAEVPSVQVFPISAASKQGILPLLRYVIKQLAQLPPVEPFEDEMRFDETGADTQEEPYRVTVVDGVYCVQGPEVRRLLENVNFDDDESMSYFQRAMRKNGMIDALRACGARDGDTVRMEDVEFDFIN